MRKVGFLRLARVNTQTTQTKNQDWTYSLADVGRGASISGPANGNCDGVGSSQGESISSSLDGVVSGVGEAKGNGRSLDRKLKGALCGSGEISMESGTQQGDEEGIGGVVTPSHRTGGVVVPSARAQYQQPQL